MRNCGITYEMLLFAFQHDDIFGIDETSFYFDDDAEQQDHMIGCIRGNEFPPYWVGYCDIENGCEFETAEELFQAKIFDGHSIQERWEHLVLDSIGCISTEGWLDIYKKNFKEFGKF